MDPKPTSYFFICLKISSERLAKEKDELPSLDLQERKIINQKKKRSREKTQICQEVTLERRKKKKRLEKTQKSREVILEKKTKRVKKEIVVDDVLDHHRHHLPIVDLPVDDDEAKKKETVVDVLDLRRHHLPTDDLCGLP